MWSNIVQSGLDVHRKFSILAGRDASGKIVRRERLEHADREQLRRRLRLYPPGMPVFLEASFGWSWMSDELHAAGLAPRLANGRKVAALRENRGQAKSNRKDAEGLSELGYERTSWWEVWLAPAEVRRMRELMRHRMALVRMQTSMKLRVHAALHRHGILQTFSDLFGVSGRKFLEELIEDAQAPLPDSARLVIQDNLQLLDQARRRLAKMLKLYHRQFKSDADMRRLKTLPGIGLLLAFTIMAEIGRISRFKTCRHLISYCLLAPIADDSGDDDGTAGLGRHVGHIGRVTLKWAFIEAAHGAVQKKGEFRDLFNRITDNGTKNKNRGYIAVAHRLAQLADVLLRKQVDYTPVRPPRPGSKPLSGDAPRPDRPMAPSQA
jgi:transposase